MKKQTKELTEAQKAKRCGRALELIKRRSELWAAARLKFGYDGMLKRFVSVECQIENTLHDEFPDLFAYK